MPKLICGWCYKEFDKKITAGKSGDRDIIICPHCGRTLPSSKKQLNEDKERCPICKSYDHVNYDDTSGECDKEMKHKSLSEKEYKMFNENGFRTRDVKQSIKELQKRLDGWMHDDILLEIFGENLI